MRIIVAVTGASGATLAARLLQILEKKKIESHLIVSEAGKEVAKIEGVKLKGDYEYGIGDFASSIASGSFKNDGMVIIPCSMNTLAKLAQGFEDNLILRAAAVNLKEDRKLVVVPRETPLNFIQIKNLLDVKKAGAHILLPVLGFYHKPVTLKDEVDFVMGKLLDLLGIENDLFKRWGSKPNK